MSAACRAIVLSDLLIRDEAGETVDRAGLASRQAVRHVVSSRSPAAST